LQTSWIPGQGRNDKLFSFADRRLNQSILTPPVIGVKKGRVFRDVGHCADRNNLWKLPPRLDLIDAVLDFNKSPVRIVKEVYIA
jgi:hypothetical protein